MELYTWIDASYATPPDMRGQTGEGAMSMGWGMMHCKSGKQKLNTKSSTESELVGTSEYVPYNIHAVMFLAVQGYLMRKNVLYQDNQSSIRMEKNGRNSCTGNSRHINIRYFFVKDRVDKGELIIEYCPTEKMLADFFTKPLQGRQFKLMRDIIMGHKPISILLPTIKERVEKVSNYGATIGSDVSPNRLNKNDRLSKKSYKQALLDGN
mmetsp:Transcript_11440/g.14339  ORF Transcript_11440/g.14339 Transcript_11440/m.14339 type:complete len:209 (+) Transcript_11440:405-1031(+)